MPSAVRDCDTIWSGQKLAEEEIQQSYCRICLLKIYRYVELPYKIAYPTNGFSRTT